MFMMVKALVCSMLVANCYSITPSEDGAQKWALFNTEQECVGYWNEHFSKLGYVPSELECASTGA